MFIPYKKPFIARVKKTKKKHNFVLLSWQIIGFPFISQNAKCENVFKIYFIFIDEILLLTPKMDN